MTMHEKITFQMQQSQPKFCYLLIDFQPEAYSGYAVILLTLIFLGISFVQFWHTKTSKKLNFNIRIIYLSILTYPVFFMSKIIISQIAFWNTYQTDQDQEIIFSFNSFLSKYIFFSQFFQFFFFQMMILMVSYNWIGNIIQIFQYMLGQQESEIYVKQEKIVLKIIKICLIIRIIELSLIIPYFIQENPIVIAKIAIFVWMLQQFIMSTIFILDVYLINKNEKLRQLLEDEDRTDMIKNYGFLAVLLLIGFIWSIVFTVDMLPDHTKYNNAQCWIDTNNKLEIFWAIFLFLKAIVLYMILFMVLRIFKIKQSGSISTNSYNLMDTTTEDSVILS